MSAIADDCARAAESGLRPPFESPHLAFPEKKFGALLIRNL